MRSTYTKTFGILMLSILAVSCGSKKSSDNSNQQNAGVPNFSVNGLGYTLNGNGVPVYQNTSCMRTVYDSSNQAVCVAYESASASYNLNNNLSAFDNSIGAVGSVYWLPGGVNAYGYSTLRGFTLQADNRGAQVEARVGSDAFSIPANAQNFIRYFGSVDGQLQLGQALDAHHDYDIELRNVKLSLCLDANRAARQCP